MVLRDQNKTRRVSSLIGQGLWGVVMFRLLRVAGLDGKPLCGQPIAAESFENMSMSPVLRTSCAVR